ncbi:hypothetical protein P7C70_g9561, partial [Phenoliferia sp. Uapishka_3]
AYKKPSARKNRGVEVSPAEERGFQEKIKKARSRKGKERTEEEVLEAKFDEDMAESALVRLDQAIRDRRASDDQLNSLFPNRTAPWLATCTTEEALERARILKEEYDRFLHVLFGRDLPLIQENKKASGEGSPAPPTAPKGMSAREECRGMMFPEVLMPTSQQLQISTPIRENVDPKLTTLNPGDEGERLGDVPPNVGEAEPELNFSEWLVDGEEQIRNPIEDSQTRPETTRLNGDEETSQDDEMYGPDPSRLTEEELVKELGLQLEGTELTANYVEWLDAEEWAELYEWGSESAATYTDEEDQRGGYDEESFGNELTVNMVAWEPVAGSPVSGWSSDDGDSSESSGPPGLIPRSDSEPEDEDEDEYMRGMDEIPDERGTYASDDEFAEEVGFGRRSQEAGD